jgi:hypothetical protein
MGNNFDRLFVGLRYTPLPRLKCQLNYQYIRKGGAGTVEQQYFQQPQPPFLFNPQFNRSEISFRCSYEVINNLNLWAFFNDRKQQSLPSGITSRIREGGIGFSFGL